METKAAAAKTGTPIQKRCARIRERLERIEVVLKRDAKNKGKVAALAQEKKMLGLELEVNDWKAGMGA